MVMRYSVVRRTIWCGFWLSMPNSWASSSVGASIIVSASNWSISFGKFLKLRPVGGDLGAAACAQRWGQPRILSLAHARLSGVVSLPPRADAALSALHDPSQLDAG